MSIAYATRVLDIISEKKLRDTMLGVAKQTGALVGSVIGAVVGYQMSEDYDNIITVLRGMSDEDKARLGTKVKILTLTPAKLE
ncbi:hypothetical protein WR25_16080 [Diploscapter pachys]|uniref:Uncharacterized protein n=1 Tax=Diploscapter pachys TaxID=2018661 RepID=A0A2A2KJ89_9BILA|nr:hypothetical protein WR25_16080 [Diploscapter pachys]